MTKLKIGIIGSGQVAQTLGNGFIKLGYEVLLGTREFAKVEEWKKNAGINASIGTFEEASAFGDTVILAVKGSAAEDLIKCEATRLVGKTVIDATNPIDASASENGVLRFFTNQNESLMERLQNLAPEAHFVKAFNSVGSALMVNPTFDEGQPTMFIAGNNSESKKKVTEILIQFGWDVNDLGKAEAARPIESLCILWCLPGFTQNNWKHALRFIKK